MTELALPEVNEEEVRQQIAEMSAADLQKFQLFLGVTKLVGAGMSVDEACEKAGVARSTYYYWVSEKGFRKILAGTLRETTVRAQALIADQWPRVVKELLRIAVGEDPDARPRERVQAAEFLHEISGLEPVTESGEVKQPVDVLGRLMGKVSGSTQINIFNVNRGSEEDHGEVIDGEAVRYYPVDG